jgi:hypothetical protein
MIHFFYRLDTPDKDILAQLEKDYEEDIVNVKMARCWASKFCSGRTDFDNEPKPGRPRHKENCK